MIFFKLFLSALLMNEWKNKTRACQLNLEMANVNKKTANQPKASRSTERCVLWVSDFIQQPDAGLWQKFDARDGASAAKARLIDSEYNICFTIH